MREGLERRGKRYKRLETIREGGRERFENDFPSFILPFAQEAFSLTV